MFSPPCAGFSVVLLSETRDEVVLRENRDSQFPGFEILGRRGFHVIVNQVIGLFGDAACHLTAVCLHIGLEGITVFEAVGITGNDECQSGAASGDFCYRFLFRNAHEVQKLIENASVLLVSVPVADTGSALRSDTVHLGKVLAFFQRLYKSRPAAGVYQFFGSIQADLRDAQRIQETHGIRCRPGFLDRSEQFFAAAFPESLDILDLFGKAINPVDIRNRMDKPESDKTPESLGCQTVDIYAGLADKTLEFLQVLRRALRIVAFERLGAAGACRDTDRPLAGRAALRKGIFTDSLGDADNLGDDLVGLDDLDLSLAVLPYSQTVAELKNLIPGPDRVA